MNEKQKEQLELYFETDYNIQNQDSDEYDNFITMEMNRLNTKPKYYVFDSTSYNNCTHSMKAYAIDMEKLYNDQLELLESKKYNSKLLYFPITMISIIVISLFTFIGYLYYQIFFNGQ